MKTCPSSDWHEKLEGLPELENLGKNRQKQQFVKSSTRSLRQCDGNLVIVAFSLLFRKGLLFVLAHHHSCASHKNLPIKVSFNQVPVIKCGIKVKMQQVVVIVTDNLAREMASPR